MPCDRLPGNDEALDAISAITGRSRSDLVDEFHALSAGGDTTSADPARVERALRGLVNRVRLAPALPRDRKAVLQDTLTEMLPEPPSRSNAHVDAWQHLIRHYPEPIRTLDRPPLVLPVMDGPQEAAWHALMDFDDELDESWVLVGGQMTMIHCLENGVPGYRATDDGDVVLGVWTRRDALATAARLLVDRDFAQADTADGFAYRYTRGATKIDLMLPDNLERQHNSPGSWAASRACRSRAATRRSSARNASPSGSAAATATSGGQTSSARSSPSQRPSAPTSATKTGTARTSRCSASAPTCQACEP
ncbi:MAG: hypothetical protein LC789_14540 [Actinobacteria bacterium]|nr:hypothetical protein [Actinomycetota bacterium]MCA1721325.1 hypothetical protein [Actinomycetota bacterium]